MRRIIFWLMVAIVLFLVIVLGIAARKHVSPKALINSWFSSAPAAQAPAAIVHTGEDQAIHDAIEAKLRDKQLTSGSENIVATGELSAEDQAQVQDFMNSVVQTP